MTEVNFIYKGIKHSFQFKYSEKIKELKQRFKDKLKIDNDIHLLHEGNSLKEELTIQELINNEIYHNNCIKILVVDLLNEITGVIDVFKENENIKIINSFDQWALNNKKKIEDLEEKNEKEIKDNITILIDGKAIPFNYSFKFKKAGKYIIKYKFKFDNNITKLDYIFADCQNLIKIDLSDFKLGNFKTMNHMFYNCKSLKEIILPKFSSKNKVVDISYMFYGCESLIKLDLNSFYTNNINNLSYLFGNCFSLENLYIPFNTSNVKNMSGLFFGCKSLKKINLSWFNTMNVINMDRMFFGCSSLSNINISKFNIANTISLKEMFSGCSSLKSLDLSNFDTRNVINMHGFLSDCISLVYVDISSFMTEKCTDIGHLFSNCCSLMKLPDISDWDTRNVTDMSNLFFNCSAVKSLPNISKWNTSKVENMSGMFSGCSSLESIPDISNWNTSEVKNISLMFSKCRSLLRLPNISQWENESILDMKGLFQGCSFILSYHDLSKWKLLKKKNKSSINMKKGNFINNEMKLKLVNKLNTENIIRNDNLKFLPQIEICFDQKDKLDLKEYLNLRNELKQIFQEEDFSIIEIKKGNISMIITLQFLIFSELKNIHYYWLWESETKEAIDLLNNNFDKNITIKIKKLITKCKEKLFISLGSVKPKYADDYIVNLSDLTTKEAIIKNMQEMVTDDFFKDLNIIEFCKNIEEQDLEEYFSILRNQSYEQEKNQLKILKDLKLFNKVFDVEIEKSLFKSIFEYKIIYIFLSNNDNIDNYKREKNRCPNKKIKILLHGTSPRNVTSIISSQFRQSVDQSSCTFGRGVYFSNNIDYIWFYYSDEDRGIFNSINTIPKINESFSFVASEIYYDSNKLEQVFDTKKDN